LITRWRKIKKVSYKDTKMIDLKMKIKDVEMDCEVLEELANNNLFIYCKLALATWVWREKQIKSKNCNPH
jgi:hypothetical protein